jgi:hypothetical protein
LGNFQRFRRLIEASGESWRNYLAKGMNVMKTMRRWQSLGGLGLTALMLGTVVGCQTNVAGMTLPSPHYLQHPPQYIQESPPFPLSRELASMQTAGAPVAASSLPAPLPAPVMPAPVAVPAAPPVNPK